MGGLLKFEPIVLLIKQLDPLAFCSGSLVLKFEI
jgi:hypothetical protein